ncbi:MAG: bifunctional oligoribonuclease/PAP phosphatase NrnA [Armatimonadetes bacterium]|nr:MAG: bifunctional oligoribonuclease/PAP phosphatase NrnA [Armatimonadota bacterium]
MRRPNRSHDAGRVRASPAFGTLLSLDNALEQFRHWLEEAGTILLTGHTGPDADTVGACLAMYQVLEAFPATRRVLMHDPVPKNLQFLPHSSVVEVVGTDFEPGSAWRAADLAVVMDLSVRDRLGRVLPLVEGAHRVVVVDHHEPSGDAFGDLLFIDSSAPATCLILFRIFQALSLPISPGIAQCLLAGIATDTGNFAYANTTPEALQAAAALVERGADLTLINEEVWNKRPLSALQILGRVLTRIESRCDGRVLVSHLTLQDFEELVATDEETEGAVNELLRAETACAVALLRELRPGRVRVSLRSRGAYDVAAVCREFGGGGHRNAAGCTIESSVDEAKRLIREALERCVGSC